MEQCSLNLCPGEQSFCRIQPGGANEDTACSTPDWLLTAHLGVEKALWLKLISTLLNLPWNTGSTGHLLEYPHTKLSYQLTYLYLTLF